MADSTGILQPYPVLFDKSGQPLDAGYVYVGQYGLNPETSQINVYWDEDLTQPAPQPIRTINGYYSRNGTPAKIFISGAACSISVRDKSQSVVFNDLFSSGQVIANGLPASLVVDSSGLTQQQINDKQDILNQTVNSVSELVLVSNPYDKMRLFLKSYHSNLDIGGDWFYFDSSKSKTLHDGGMYIDNTKTFPADFSNTTQVSDWLTANVSGLGVWVRAKTAIPTIFDYGFIPDSLSHNASNTLVFQKLVDKNIVSRVPVYDAPLYVTNGINVKNGRRIVGDSDYMGEPLLADPDRGIIGDGSGTVFTTGTYPATANTNRQLHFKSLRVRNTDFPCFDLLHSDDAVLDDCIAYTTNGTAVRQFFSARVRYLGGHYASSFTALSDDNFCIRIYDNCNGTWISPTTVIAGGTNGGGVDVTQSQKMELNGIIETNGGFGIRVGGYTGGDLAPWQSSTAYVRGQLVQANTLAWVCTTDHTSSASFTTDQATKWKVISGNCNGISINGYIEATNKPISIGAKNLVLGVTIAKESAYIGSSNAASPAFSIQLGAVSGLNIGGGLSIHKKGTEPTIHFVQPSSGSSITDFLTNSQLKNFHVQGGGSDYLNSLTVADQIGLVFGRNEIKFSQNGVSSGQTREFVSPQITANVGLALNAFIIDSGNGGIIDSIEVINATGTLGCSLRVGNSTTESENLLVDPSTLTLSNGASTTTLASTLIRPAKQQTIRVVAGAGTGSFRVRIRYRI